VKNLKIVKEYQIEMAREYPDVPLDVDFLEGYILVTESGFRGGALLPTR
jgi:hypothetical protein